MQINEVIYQHTEPRNLVPYKVISLILFISIFGMFVYDAVASIWASILSIAIFIIMWWFVLHVKARFNSKPFKDYISLYSYNVPTNLKTEADTHDYLFFDEEAFPAWVSILSEGIYMYRSGICSCVVPWKNIKKIFLFMHKGISLARLTLTDANEIKSDSLCIPWVNKFNEVLPDEHKGKLVGQNTGHPQEKEKGVGDT